MEPLLRLVRLHRAGRHGRPQSSVLALRALTKEMSMSTWKGTKVKHADGRQGGIKDDWSGFLHRGLKIDVDGGTEAFVQLNSNGPDTGEVG